MKIISLHIQWSKIDQQCEEKMQMKNAIQYLESLGQTKVDTSQKSNPGGMGGDLAQMVKVEAKVRS